MGPTTAGALARRGAWAVAAGRTALGVAALAWPSGALWTWVGPDARGSAGRVLGRALGGRDIALGLGALSALSRLDCDPGRARAWVAAGALSDALDVTATLAVWRELPRAGRSLVAAASVGAAVAGLAGCLALPRSGQAARSPARQPCR